MADSVLIRLEGDRDLVAAFKALRTDMGPKWLMRAARRGAGVIKTVIRASAPEDTGKLRRNIRIRTRKTRETVRAGVVINTAGKADNPRNAFYWRFVEFGHRVRKGSAWGPHMTRAQYIRKKGTRRHRAGSGGYAGPTSDVPPQPFVEPSWNAWKNYGTRLMTEAFERAIDNEARKQRRGKK